MSGLIRQFLADTIMAKGLAASATLHLFGLGILALVGVAYDSMSAPAGDRAFQVSVEIREADPFTESYAAAAPSQPTVLVTPDRVRVEQRWFRRVPSNVNPPNVEQLQATEPIVPEQFLTADDERSQPTDALDQAVSSRELELEKPPAKAPEVVATTQVETDVTDQQNSQKASSAAVLGYGDAPPQFTHQPSPVYPHDARSRRVEGTVLLGLDIDVNGNVTEVRVLRSSGSSLLDAAAVSAVRKWRCRPRQRAGVSVASTETLPVHFRLR